MLKKHSSDIDPNAISKRYSKAFVTELLVNKIHSDCGMGLWCHLFLVEALAFKMNGYTFRGSNSTRFYLVPVLISVNYLRKEFAHVREVSIL